MVNFDITLTVMLFIIFIGIILWAWSPGRKSDFEDAAQLVVDDDIDNVDSNTVAEGQKHG